MNKYLEEFSIEDYTNFDKYYELLVETNKVMNLTGITEYEEVYIKHFYDSLLLTKCNNNLDNIVDVGSGAGFPGMVLAIANPNLDITLLEPLGKRCRFLNTVKEELNLNNVKVVTGRAENCRDKYMYATARAVAPMNVLLELIIPILKLNGIFYCMKGDNYQEELDKSANAIKALDLVIDAIYHFDLPNGLGKRTIIAFKKVKETRKIYPRRYSVILKQPL